MSRMTLWIAAGVFGAIAAGLALWARITYGRVEATQSYVYTLSGWPVSLANAQAATDAAASVSTITAGAWVTFLLAVAAGVVALLKPADVHHSEPSNS